MFKRLVKVRNLLGMIFLSAGCAAYHSLPPDWGKDIPGVYEGSIPPFKESVTFNTNGTYLHEVYEGQNKIVSESGTWNYKTNVFEINLEPAGSFTECYGIRAKQFIAKGKPFADYVYFPLPDGKSFTNISASGNFEFMLSRKTKF